MIEPKPEGWTAHQKLLLAVGYVGLGALLTNFAWDRFKYWRGRC